MATYATNPLLSRYIQGAPGPTPLVITKRYHAHYSFAPANASTTAILAATALLVSAQAGFTTGLNDPDFARFLTVKGGAAGQNKTVTIHGTDISGNVISEAFTLNGTSTVNGTKAFRTVTSVDLPAWNADGDTVAVGTRNIFGMPHIPFGAAALRESLFDGSDDAGSLAITATLCTTAYTLAGTPNGAKVVDLIYYV